MSVVPHGIGDELGPAKILILREPRVGQGRGDSSAHGFLRNVMI